MKLEIGMYVRTKYGIAKYIKDLVTRETIYRLIDKKIVCDNVEDWEDCLLDNEISKASHNIIDLIEVGDYVNGKLVVDKWEEPDWYGYFIKLEGEKTIPTIRKIESVVTKEQFESMSYKIERG